MQTTKNPARGGGVQVLITAVGLTALWDYCCTGSHQDGLAKPSRISPSCALPPSACAPFELLDELGEQPDALHVHRHKLCAADRG